MLHTVSLETCIEERNGITLTGFVEDALRARLSETHEQKHGLHPWLAGNGGHGSAAQRRRHRP